MRRPVGLLLALVLASAACTSAEQAERADAPPPPSGDAAGLLAFSAPTVDGGTVEGDALRGEALALWFWAPW